MLFLFIYYFLNIACNNKSDLNGAKYDVFINGVEYSINESIYTNYFHDSTIFINDEISMPLDSCISTRELLKPLNDNIFESCEYISFQFLKDTLVSIGINILKDNFKKHSILINDSIELYNLQVEKDIKSIVYPIENYLVTRKEIMIDGITHYLFHIRPKISRMNDYNCWGITSCENNSEE